MSQLLHAKYNLVNKNGKHKDRNNHSRKPVNNLKKKVDDKLNDIIFKPWFRFRKLTKDKIERNIRLLIKDEMNELKYIRDHYRTGYGLEKHTRRIIKQINETIDKMVHIGIE